MFESIIFLMVLVILVQTFLLKSALNEKTKYLNDRLDQMANLLIRIRDVQQDVTRSQKAPVPPVSEKSEKESQPEPVITPAKSPTPAPEPKVPEPKKPEPKAPEKKEVIVGETITPPIAKPLHPQPEKPRKPGFFERNPDLEKFIGENLANKIGIAILVLGIGFFVKFAIDQQWIGVYGRVFIGILCGAILIGVAHRLRQKFTAFSSVLVGGGIAVFYITIAIAFHEYGILPQSVAFGIMVVITAFTVFLSIMYNRVELAVLAILGGFGSPLMVSTGEGNYIVLFTYITLLNIGMLVLAYFKKWNLVNIVSYVSTVLLFGSWLGVSANLEDANVRVGALIFATVFYLLFFAMNIVNNLKLKRPFKAIEFTLLLSNTFLYFAAGMVILDYPGSTEFKGLFTALVAVFNFVFAYALFRNNSVDRNLVFLLIGLVLTFISLAAPIQLEGNYITLFWAAETVILLWLSQRSGIILMKYASGAVMVLMWISLMMDWLNIYGVRPDEMLVILNKGYITTVAAVISTALVLYRMNYEPAGSQLVELARPGLTLVIVGILYIGNLLELRYHLDRNLEDYAGRTVIIGAYNMLFILLLILSQRFLRIQDSIKQGFPVLGVLAILSYFFVYHPAVLDTRYFYISGEVSATGFVFHYVLVILLLIVAAWSLVRIRTWEKFNAKTYNLYAWFFVFFFVFMASAELDHTVLLATGTSVETQYYVLAQNSKIGYPILWGVSAFILIAVGLRTKRKHLRIISLTLLSITLLKLFLVDIRGISDGGKIAAFTSLGALLLIVSFMYQRLKKLWQDESEVAEKKEEI